MNSYKYIINIILIILLFSSIIYSNSKYDKFLTKISSKFSKNNIDNIRSIIFSYSKYIKKVSFKNNDVIFNINGKDIYYMNGKMLLKKNINKSLEFESIFYRYYLKTLNNINLKQDKIINRSSDLLDSLAGETENSIRKKSSWIKFLDHKVYVHNMCKNNLLKINNEITKLSKNSYSIKNFIKNIAIIYSMKRKKVKGSKSMSYHSYGLAIDLWPKKKLLKHKHIYWKWSSIFNKKWYKIPLKKRWHPPNEIIKIFEKNGFIWGGKWYHFDSMHFEYRPEIIYISKLLNRT